ncbi:MAG: LAGLIDADG family homing endonuclease [Patescibacteria group bacterium]|nr:LAGLIDADG family homing endonuclease [Patescibacteria group bacterium]
MIQAMQEVSRAHSTKRKPFERNPRLKDPFGKEQIQCKKLNPYYVSGFIDGEGSFSVSINRHKTLKRGVEIKPEFEIELRDDDRKILERIVATIGCGRIYDCSYERYGWHPHAKLKVTSTRDLTEILFPFLDRHPLEAKKADVYKLFKKIVLAMREKEHLTDKGFERIQRLRNKMRKFGKKHNFKKQFDPALETARIRENRSSGGV